ncbi:hypothetical protein ET495_10380 [Xylanimonas allomyrinae]|uniref:Alternate-type signal peptide domain-containing protein n=1 Tax=Xylanimonas allomyrinae TaxID=2509459 RepID=A0A4P6ETA7_9MICO|nr:SipW-dependent-type signal peptide-containing protein [Xylanimonas allomyrinae]QAY63587.1 hypothetical protein ET495_10380 [Xylanimonas allomyrinae]
MSSTTPVIVMTEERRRGRGPLWVAAAAVLVLGGGSTFAYWHDAQTYTGGSIVSGTLDVSPVGEMQFWDVSADRADATTALPGTLPDGEDDGPDAVFGHEIDDPSAWRMSPEDRVGVTVTADVTLEGDNLVAALTLDGSTGIDLASDGVTYTYAVYRDGATLVAPKPLTDLSAPLLYLSAATDGQEAGADDADGSTVLAMTDGQTTDRLTVLVTATFDADAQQFMSKTYTFANVQLSLEQVRTQGLGSFVAP